jgi:hypothetical protein
VLDVIGHEPRDAVPDDVSHGLVLDAAERDAAGRPGPRRITVDNAAELFLVSVLTGHVDEILAVAFSPVGGLVATGARDGRALIQEARSGEVRHVLTVDGVHVKDVAFSPDGELLATADLRGAQTWDTATGESVRRFPGHGKPVNGVAFSPADGGLLATCSWDRTARVWDAHTGVALARPALERRRRTPRHAHRALEPDQDGRVLIRRTAAGNRIGRQDDPDLVGAGRPARGAADRPHRTNTMSGIHPGRTPRRLRRSRPDDPRMGPVGGAGTAKGEGRRAKGERRRLQP